MVDTIQGLTPEQRNARDLIYSVLNAYDLEGLADDVLRYIQQGLSGDSIMLSLQATMEWKTRFAANEERKRKGYDLLTPDEIISTERAYREVLRAEGFPAGFYDQPSDFVKGIGNDMAPAELVRRIGARKLAFDSNYTGTAEWFQSRYGTDRAGSFAAFIDPDRALPILEKQAAAATIGAAGLTTGFGDITTATAERLAERGISGQQALSGFGEIAGITSFTHQLPGQQGATVTAEDLIAAEFEDDAAAKQKIKQVQGARSADFTEGGGGSFATSKEGVTGLRTAGK